jgi:hypothetical protein
MSQITLNFSSPQELELVLDCIDTRRKHIRRWIAELETNESEDVDFGPTVSFYEEQLFSLGRLFWELDRQAQPHLTIN